MAAISIRGLDERVAERLKWQAKKNGRSMEAEARAVLEAGLPQPTPYQKLVEVLAEDGLDEKDVGIRPDMDPFEIFRRVAALSGGFDLEEALKGAPRLRDAKPRIIEFD